MMKLADLYRRVWSLYMHLMGRCTDQPMARSVPWSLSVDTAGLAGSVFLGAYQWMPMFRLYCKCGCFHTCANSSDIQRITRRETGFFYDGPFYCVHGTGSTIVTPPKPAVFFKNVS